MPYINRDISQYTEPEFVSQEEYDDMVNKAKNGELYDNLKSNIDDNPWVYDFDHISDNNQ